ncbi:MAG: VTT domain-containing protein [Natronomonas sp.]
MYEAVVDAAVGLLNTYGVVILLVVFALEGALVGKLIPTRALFVAAVLTVGSDAFGLASVFVAAVLGATLGQLVLFWLVRYADADPENLPGESAADRIEGWFDRWGLPAVAISNTLPVARGSLTVPAAVSDEGPIRFSASSLVGSSVYAFGLVLVAAGIDISLGLL